MKEPEKHVGAPPAITHTTVTKAFRLQPVEINAKLIGDTGVSKAMVFFRHVGEHDFRELPMGNIGGDDYTATMPASVVTDDLEYYLEAYDQYGNGPGHSGGPNVPYQISVTVKPPEVIVKPPERKKKDRQTHPQPRPGQDPLLAQSRSLGRMDLHGRVRRQHGLRRRRVYGGYQTDQVYQQTFKFDGRIDNSLHQTSLDYVNRAKNVSASPRRRRWRLASPC